MKYYPKNSDTIEYVEITEAVEKDGYTLIIQPKNHRSFVGLQCTIELAKKEEIPTMSITISPDNFQIFLKLFENSDHLTLFRWMIDYKLITREFSSMLYKVQYEKLAVQYNQSKSLFTGIPDIFQNPQDVKNNNAPQPT